MIKLTAGVALTSLLVLAAWPASRSVSAAAAPHRPVAGAYCHAGEAVVFACANGTKLAVVCATATQATYRYGAPGKPEIEITSNGKDGAVHASIVVGQGGGGQTSLRFSRVGYNYVVSAGTMGSLSDHPGRRWWALTAMRDNTVLSTHDCKVLGPKSIETPSFIPDETEAKFQAWY